MASCVCTCGKVFPNTVGLQMHQMDTDHLGTVSNSTHIETTQGFEDQNIEVEQDDASHQPPSVADESDDPDHHFQVMSPDRLSEEVKKVLSDMNDIVMGIHDIIDDDGLDDLIHEYSKEEKSESASSKEVSLDENFNIPTHEEKLDDPIHEHSKVEANETVYSKEVYLESLNESFNIPTHEEKVSGSLVEMLVTYGTVYEKSVRSERKLEEKENDLVEMKKSYDMIVKDKQSADIEMERMRGKLNDFEAAFEEKEREIVLLKLDLADREVKAGEAVRSSDHGVAAVENKKETGIALEVEFIKDEVKGLKELLLKQLGGDSVASLNETAASLPPIPHDIETPRIMTDIVGDMQDETIEEVKEVEEPVHAKKYKKDDRKQQLNDIRKSKHVEYKLLKQQQQKKQEHQQSEQQLPQPHLPPPQQQQQPPPQQQQPPPPLQQQMHAESSNYTWNPSTDNIDLENLQNIYKGPLPKRAQWKEGTTLIIGDSMIGGIDEGRLRNAKVRVNPGSTVEDMFFHITPYLRKMPTNIICHIGTNNATDDTSEVVMHKLCRLKEYILAKVPNCKIYFSSPIVRSDDEDAARVVEGMINKMFLLETELVNNSNIGVYELAKKGLHLNGRGTRKLAVNFIEILKALYNP